MPWVRARLKQSTVFAKVTDDGSFLSSSGKVEVRYHPNDGRKYFARIANLQKENSDILPDETCGTAEKSTHGNISNRSINKRTGSEIELENEPFFTIYTDGACSGNPGPGGIGVVILDGATRIEHSEFLGHCTNNIAELTAILRAIELVDNTQSLLKIHTDSQYSIGVLVKNWKVKANKELISELKKRIQEHRAVRLIYVQGHAGIKWNERTDELARMAVQTKNSSTHLLTAES